MKKLLVLVAAVLLFSLNPASAQKYGHVNSSEILELMPFQTELQNEYQNMVQEYQQKKDKFDREVGTMSSSVRQLREKDLEDLANRIQVFQANVQDDLEEKQYELAKPFQDKIQNAINKVAKDHGYAYIFDTKILLYFENGEDITPLVKKELGIK